MLWSWLPAPHGKLRPLLYQHLDNAWNGEAIRVNMEKEATPSHLHRPRGTNAAEKARGHALFLENLKTLPENHQSPTAWVYTNTEARQATGMTFHLWAMNLRLYNNCRHTKPDPFINVSEEPCSWSSLPDSHCQLSLPPYPCLGVKKKRFLCF